MKEMEYIAVIDRENDAVRTRIYEDDGKLMHKAVRTSYGRFSNVSRFRCNGGNYRYICGDGTNQFNVKRVVIPGDGLKAEGDAETTHLHLTLED